MLARIFYTVNWFNVPAIFIFIAVDFDEDISVLGLITASFFIGVGLFQVLAGILAAKYSPRKIAILGIAIASTAVFFSAFSIDLLSIAVLRFIVGIGMAFFFGPSVILISEYVGKQSEGLGMGLLNSASCHWWNHRPLRMGLSSRVLWMENEYSSECNSWSHDLNYPTSMATENN